MYIGELGSGSTFDKNSIWKIFLFSLISLVCIFFISWLETDSFVNKELIKYKISKIFNFISIKSYCIYLIHYNIYVAISSKAQGAKEFAFAIVITFIIASLINIFYEIPIMNLRDKINFGEKKNPPNVSKGEAV